MKKVFLAIVMAIGIGAVNAQEINFGVKGGLNVSDFSNSKDVKTEKPRYAYQVGGVVELKLGDRLGVQGEVLFSAQGSKATDNITIKHDYVNIPVMAKLYLLDKLFIEAGPQIGFLVNAKMGSDNELLDKIIGKLNYEEMLKKTDFALNVGAGFYLTDNINLGVRYSYGLNDTTKIGEEINKLFNNKNPLSKNVNLQATLTYYFR